MEATIKKAKTYKQCNEMQAVFDKALDDGNMSEDSYFYWSKVLRQQRMTIDMKYIVAKMNRNPNTPTVTHNKHGKAIPVEKIP